MGPIGLTERKGGADVPAFADPGRMEYLASLYSELGTSRAVQTQIERKGTLPPGAYNVAPLTTPDGRALPLIEVMGMSERPSNAVLYSNRVANGLRRYIRLKPKGQQPCSQPNESSFRWKHEQKPRRCSRA